jgi:ribonuclease R
VAPLDSKLPSKILITNDVAEHKDKIVEVEITRFASPNHWPAGKVVHAIGFLDDPNVETVAIIRKFGFPAAFPKEVEEEAREFPDELSERDFLGRDDMRRRNIITIDPKTARDFDDAVDVEILEDGSYQLGVHIVDASALVRRIPPWISRRGRAALVYFPDRVIPMLPECLKHCVPESMGRSSRDEVIMHIHRTEKSKITCPQQRDSFQERMTYEDVQENDRRRSGTLRDLPTFSRKCEINRWPGFSRNAMEGGAIDFICGTDVDV